MANADPQSDSSDMAVLRQFQHYPAVVPAHQHTWQGPWSAPKLDDALRVRFVEQVLPHALDDDYYVQEKLDGQMLMYTGMAALTKSGNEYANIPSWFREQALPPGLPLIGEIFRGPGWGNEALRGIAAQAADTQDSADVWAHKWESAKFVVFDIPGLTKTPYRARYEVLSLFVRKWNRTLLDKRKSILPPTSLPLQCIRSYSAAEWPKLLREVMLQPVVRQFPPWGDVDGVCMVSDNSISLNEQHPNMSRAFCPAGEGLVFHHQQKGWVGRHTTAEKKQHPTGIKLKPRLLMPARVVSHNVRMWGEHSTGNNRLVAGYKIRVSYYHPGRRQLAETYAMVVPSVGVTTNSVADMYPYGCPVFLTTFGVTYSTGNLRAHPIANRSLLSWQVHGLTESLAQGVEGVERDDGDALLGMLGWVRDGATALIPRSTETTSHARTSLLLSLCRSATALPLHPSTHTWPFQRLLCTTHTDTHIRRRYLPTMGASPRVAPMGDTMLVPNSLVPRDIQGGGDNVTDGLVQGSTLAHFVRIMAATVNHVDKTQEGVTTLLRPIYAVAQGDILTSGLVTQWCGLQTVSGHNTESPGLGALICLCECIVLTCCARIWRDVEGRIGRVWDDTQCRMQDTHYRRTFVGTVLLSLQKAVQRWNGHLKDMGFNNEVDRAHRRDNQQPLDIIIQAMPSTLGVAKKWVLTRPDLDRFERRLPDNVRDAPFRFVEECTQALATGVPPLPPQPRIQPAKRARDNDLMADLRALEKNV